ncbi:MAG: ribose 5-phosphate isomerase A [Gammaproteobacteria bacterium TMED78]|nr:MAG: ribose 5-phosphate isomerase A [Gammaproteobacteria bacterium TMED78]|tara:strand:- start:163 stop:822 length:660 start_codon:yes stop_codon:yes gene_type:complete
MNKDKMKKRAALEAINYIQDGSSLGIGTGSTVDFLIEALPSSNKRFTKIVSSSTSSSKKLERVGLEVCDLNFAGDIDLYIDGADEANNYLELIKGGGGALTREKIIAQASKKFICIIDKSKIVTKLGKFPLPIEVIPMARSFIARKIVILGGQPIWRENFVTDNGNEILDIYNLEINSPKELENKINQIPGVVTVGLFANRTADMLIIADEEKVKILNK